MAHMFKLSGRRLNQYPIPPEPIKLAPHEFRAKRRENHGRHLFIYNHIQTNQVVYSLDRVLKNTDALKQLPYAGKKTLPTKLRKDHWVPLASIVFPSPMQGLAAYRQLRELRKLHEHNWNRTADYHHVLGEKTAARFANTTVLPDRKQRAKIIMNQRANTVADLAAVLIYQQKEGREQVEKLDWITRREFTRWLKLEREGGVKMVDDIIAHLEAVDETSLSVEEWSKLRVQLHDLRSVKSWMAKVKEYALEDGKTPEQIRADEQQREKAEGSMSVLERVKALSWWPSAKESKKATPAPLKLNPKMQKLEIPISYTAEGVYIEWADPHDRTYAAKWPSEVRHDALVKQRGTRHTAPPPFSKKETLVEEDDDVEEIVEEETVEEQASQKQTSPEQTPEEQPEEEKGPSFEEIQEKLSKFLVVTKRSRPENRATRLVQTKTKTKKNV